MGGVERGKRNREEKDDDIWKKGKGKVRKRLKESVCHEMVG